ncbi:unnamed protein product [Paramecium sonneborni]|uniref:Uncharacterized protein n=1 Tax=Paramecium sonneborni TaxID=65129 RepID=A0A8S1MWX5_9CILI|nr:unnamed protein product [Paramecium sonneborni]
MNINNIIKNTQNLIEQDILKHLNATCSFKNQFQIIQKGCGKNQYQNYINLIEGFTNIECQPKEIIFRLYEILPIVCQKQILEAEKQMNNFITPTSFQIQFQKDQITKLKMLIPFKNLTKDKLILNPLFCDFQIFLESLKYNQSYQNEINKIDADEQYVIMLLWRLREILNNKNYGKAQFEVILFPKQFNFGIIQIKNGIETIYFDSLEHQWNFLNMNNKFHKQSALISEALSNKEINELNINLFEIYQYDQIMKDQTIIEKKQRKNKEMKQKLDRELIKKIKQDQGIKFQKYFLIRPKNFVNIQSIFCLHDGINNYLKHSLIFDNQQNLQCKCGREFDVYTCDTLIIDKDFRDIIDFIIQEMIADKYLDYRIFLIPLFLEIEIDQYKNQFIVIFFRDKYNNKVPLKRFLFKAKNYNYDINCILEKEGDQDDLFEGEDITDYSVIEDDVIIDY